MAEEKTEGILDKAKVAVSSVTEKITEIKEDLFSEEQKAIISEFKESGTGKAKLVMEEINNSLGIIARSGYEFRGINVSIGLTPSIAISFHYKNDIPEEEETALLEETQDKKIVKIILLCLFKAGNFYNSIKMGDYVLDVVTVTLGLAPGISTGFVKKAKE